MKKVGEALVASPKSGEDYLRSGGGT